MSNVMPELSISRPEKDLTKVWCEAKIIYYDNNQNPLPKGNYEIYLKFQSKKFSVENNYYYWDSITDWFLYTKKGDTFISMQYIIEDFYNDSGKTKGSFGWAEEIRYIGYLKKDDYISEIKEGEGNPFLYNFNGFDIYDYIMPHEKINDNAIYAYVVKHSKWNEFTSLIDEMLQIYGLPQKNFNKVSRKTIFTADIYNKVASAVKSLSSDSKIEYAVSGVTPFKGSQFYYLEKEFNDILPYH